VRKSNPGRKDGDAVYIHEITTDAGAIDANGHVNNVVYVRWMQEAAIEHFRSLGGIESMEEAAGTWVARSHRIEYLRPAFLGDRLQVRTWVASVRRVRSTRKYSFARVSDGAILARGETDWVFVDVETGRPRAIPADIRRAFTVVVNGEERGDSDAGPRIA